MVRKQFGSKVSNLNKALYTGISLLLLGVAVSVFLGGNELWIFIILLVTSLCCAGLLYLPYQIRYELTDRGLSANWIFGSKEIDYSEIKGFQSFKLPLTSIRRFGISMLGGRYSHGETGKFYAIFGSRDGILIEADESSIYGGKLFISPEKQDEFTEELKERLDKDLSG